MKARARTSQNSNSIALRFIVLTAAFLLVVFFAYRWWRRMQPPAPLTHVRTLAGKGPQLDAKELADPFGMVINADGALLVSDGRGGHIYRVTASGATSVFASNLNMPSALALAPDGALIVANTGDHTILRLVDGQATRIAGKAQQSGATSTLLNAPVGVAVNNDGAVFIADTYNDRICVLEPNGTLRTLAGSGTPGFNDGQGRAAQFNTPCGLALAPDGALLIADTGNHRIRRLTLDGTVTTIAGTGEVDNRDGLPLEAAFAEPTALAVRRDGALLVADAASSTLRLIEFGNQEKQIPPSVTTITGGYPFGLQDGECTEARLNQPTGLAINTDDVVFFADSGNGLVRALLPANESLGQIIDPKIASITPATIFQRVAQSGPRWPFEPAQAKREIAGTFGEIRGEHAPDKDTWFHNGLDIPGAYGETVYAMYSERVTRPLAIDDTGETRERLRLPLFGYTHVRLGRDQGDDPLPNAAQLGFSFQTDPLGHLTNVRLRRGATIQAGQAIGTLNRLNHVHLIAGPPSAEVNALAALPLPGIADSVAPVIERVSIIAATDPSFNALTPPAAQPPVTSPLVLRDKQRIIVTAYDQADGNASYRRLGLYRLGYSVSPLTSTQPSRTTISFDRLPLDPRGPRFVYAAGSQSGYTDRTVFAYEITNELRDGAVRESAWDTAQHAPGEYLVTVTAQDFFGNQTQRQIRVVIEK